MLIALGYYPGDLDQAERLAAWLKEIGPFPGHRLLVARDIRTEAKPFENVGFDSVIEIVISNDAWNKWPQSANNVFRQCATYIELVDKAPFWLWLEPDVVIFTQDTFDILEREHIASGKVFSGDLVSVPNVEIHMSGVAIYPGLLTHHAGEAKLAVETAWDMNAKDQTVPAMHISPRILHAWKHPTFADWASVEREVLAIKPECVLFHASKDGSLINLLRIKRDPTSADVKPLPVVPVLAETSRGDEEARGSNVVGDPLPLDHVQSSREPSRQQAILCDILIKSYPPDYPLLKYCLQSITKFATGFQTLVLVHPKGRYPHFTQRSKYMPPELRILPVPEKEEDNGYLFQQTIKANAHLFTAAEYVLHIDSDTILTTNVTPQTFFRDGKPIWFVTDYEDTHSPWKESTEAFMGRPVKLEFMRRLPMFVPRRVHEKADAFCVEKYGKSLGEYIMGRQEFSEFNVLGAIAWEFLHDEIYWYNTSEHPQGDWPPLVALQTWSHGPIDEAKAKFEAVLGYTGWNPNRSMPDDGPSEREEPDPDAILGDREIIPWANNLESELEIKRLVKELKKFQTCPQYTNRVRAELKIAKVIPGFKAIKRMSIRRRRLGNVER